MFPIFYSLLFSLRVWFRSKVKLQLEIISLRHQLAITHRQNPKPRLTAADRVYGSGSLETSPIGDLYYSSSNPIL
jgi:hypothetical protein